MRLKQIRLAGFKSFVDATSVPFPQQMTAVVGPNGCGKSNVIDAVRWVLGESSAKNLRGDAMTDVIFNGSSQRKPVSQASVELVFENTQGRVQGSMADRSEIAIKRLVTRDAQSSYFLNGSKCRRRDITDIFLGTGLGPRSYAIIEQGMISRLIESKPQELRVFIEEAAGISKYKERRRETENRIRHTRDNLDRLSDVREELGKNLDKLKRQASAAERYKELKARERALKAEVTALRWLKFHQLQTQLEQQLAAEETELEKFQAAQMGDQRVLIELKEQQQDLRQQQTIEQESFYRLGAEISRIEQQLLHQRQQRQQRSSELDKVQQQLQDAKAHLTLEQQQLEEQQALLEEILPEQALCEEQVTLLQQQLESLEQTQEQVEQDWQSWQQQQFQLERQQQQWQLQLSNIQQQQSQQQQREIRLQQQLAELQQQLAVDAGSECEQSWHQAKASTEQMRIVLQQSELQLSNTQQDLQQWQRQQDRLQLQLQQLSQEQSKLQQAQQQANQQQLISQLQVEPGWAEAVSLALGALQHASISPHWPDTLSQTLLLTQPVTAPTKPAGPCLADKVQGVAIPDYFYRILLVDTDASAQQQLQSLATGYTLMTASGHWYGPNWCLLAGLDEQDSYLARAERLQQLRSEQSDLAQQEQTVFAELEAASTLLSQQQQQVASNKQALQQSEQLEQEARTQWLLRQQQMQQWQQHSQQLEQELAQLASQGEETLLQQETLTEQLLQQDELLLQHQSQESSLAQQRQELQQQLRQQRSRLEQQQQQLQQLTVQRTSGQHQLQLLQQNLVRSRQQQQQLQEREQQLLQHDEDDEPDLVLHESLQEALLQRESAETQLQQLQNQLSECEQKMRELEQGQHSILQLVNQKRQQLESLKLDAEGHRIRANNMLELLQEQKVQLKQVLEQLATDADEQKLQTELDKTSDAISRLGAINLAAIDEYQQQAERKSYLDSQHQDLTDALETLETAIRKIDRETRQRFKDTFERVDRGLRELFPKVFGGGSAYLELTDDDLLETGVSIMARPPGKKNSTIHLLSGGEKALTALSLVFSIFQLNPAPFCMLDEVDAPLDDANVGRFCNLVREMSETVQFIYISHNKIAMEMAAQLMGVTMQEPGVSRVVAVDVDDAVKMAEAS
ncbi:chromosome segregation protein SMC [Alkalimonas sp. MEB108]|uniref:Chromosome partition protein Smc n=1 Tax=Alkalimonas cellulosilytica TaxID=3058395 RepID=A0ABU7J0A0_9GAMM|nr:chromosome segregation protein SMC [Alkalimonas sp. MEB108]MEE1999924.1 chromosome segregation protein SMC [Alkalimonas sp. MEB108]